MKLCDTNKLQPMTKIAFINDQAFEYQEGDTILQYIKRYLRATMCLHFVRCAQSQTLWFMPCVQCRSGGPGRNGGKK